MKKDYIIYRLDVAHKLMMKGFELKHIAINKYYPKYNVYYFEDTVELRETVNAIIADLKR